MDGQGGILRLCRLCLVKDKVNIPIFEQQGDTRQIFLKISSCLAVKISREDKLPKNICEGCSDKLDSIFEFWNSSANAEKTLLSWLEQEEEKTGLIDQIPIEGLVKEETETLKNVNNETDPLPRKRARHTAAVKAQINITQELEDLITTQSLTKMEDESEVTDGEDKDPSYTEIPDNSDEDHQAGPSGVGKDGFESSYDEMNLFEKAAFVKKHFSKECKVILTDAKKYDFDKHKNAAIQQQKVSTKASIKPSKEDLIEKSLICHICLEKFVTRFELNCHKLCHQNEEIEDGKGKTEDATASKEKKSDYTCITCDASFSDQVEIKAHMHIQYNCKYFCKRCSRFFNTKGGFIVHLIQHNMENTQLSYNCEKCSSTFGDCYDLKRHYVLVHNQFSVKFTYSRANRPSKQATLETVKSSQSLSDAANPITGNIPIYDCAICYDVFSSRKMLERHMDQYHKVLERKVDNSTPICVEVDDNHTPVVSMNQNTQLLGGNEPTMLSVGKGISQSSTSTAASKPITPVSINQNTQFLGCNKPNSLLVEKKITKPSTSTALPQQISAVSINQTRPLLNDKLNMPLAEKRIVKPSMSTSLLKHIPAESTNQTTQLLRGNKLNTLLTEKRIIKLATSTALPQHISAVSTNQTTPLLSGNKLNMPLAEKRITKPSTPVALPPTSYILINSNMQINNQPPPITSTAPILLNPTLPSHTSQGLNLPSSNAPPTYYVVLPTGSGEDQSNTQQMGLISMVPQIKKKSLSLSTSAVTYQVGGSKNEELRFSVLKKRPSLPPSIVTSSADGSKSEGMVIPVITSVGTVTEDTDSQNPSKAWKDNILSHSRWKKNRTVLSAGPSSEIITIADPEPAAVPSIRTSPRELTPKIFVKKFAQVTEAPGDNSLLADSPVDCAFCGDRLKDSAAYRQHHSLKHM